MSSREVAVVSGAGSGIGRATALALAARGARVGLVDVSSSGIAETAHMVSEAEGTATSIVADVRDGQALKDAIDGFVQQAGGLDTVVAAAGIARGGLIHKMSDEAWDQVLTINLKGTFLLAKCTLPYLIERKAGAFLGISSDAGVMGAVGYGAYCASKHGVIGLIKAMALDYGALGIRCNVICPGFVETPMAASIFDKAPPGTRGEFERAVPMQRFARPEEVAAVAAHLSSAEASYTNGCTYLIDGGSSAGHFIR